MIPKNALQHNVVLPGELESSPGLDLTDRQRAVLDIITGYVDATGEPCSANFIARRTGAHHSTIQEHLSALHRKGWLRGSNSPVLPIRRR